MSETTENRLFLGGWICVWRKIANSTLWMDERFTKGQAWIDLLLLAQGVYATEVKDGRYREFYPGVVYWPISDLALRWQWTRTKVTRFLQVLEKAGMIALKSQPRKGTVVQILNWEQYQDPRKWKKRQVCQEMSQEMSQPVSQEMSQQMCQTKSQSSQGIDDDFQGSKKQIIEQMNDQMSEQFIEQMSEHNINQNKNQSINQKKRKGDDFPSENGKEKIPAMWRDKFESYEDYWRWRNQ